MQGDPLADITDALARGRITPAEVAAVSPSELEALFELGALRLDTGRDTDAVRIFAGLVSLFPYTAKYWRAYGISLHRLLELSRARAAYDAALLLEPAHPETLCYRGEICLYLGDLEQAISDLGAVIESGREDLIKRATTLIKCVESIAPIADELAQPNPGPTDLSEEETFTLADGRTLPLGTSRFADADEPEKEITEITAVLEPLPEEITQTAQRYVPEVADLWDPDPHGETTQTQGNAPTPYADGEITATQPLRRVTRTLRALREITSSLAPLSDFTETALIPGRPRALALAREARRKDEDGILESDLFPTPDAAAGATGSVPPPVTAPPGEPSEREVTHTAIVRRRMQQPLCVPEESREEDTVTQGARPQEQTLQNVMPPDDPEATQT